MKRIFTTTLLIGLIGILNLAAQVRIYAPQLSLPENGSIDQMPDVVLDWNAVTGGNTGIIQYEIQMDTDPGFPSPVVFETEFLSAIQTSELLFGETYFWRVRAIDGADVSSWSETWSFRVIRRIVLTKPTDASNQTTEVEIQWEAVTGITEYDYQFDTSFYWTGVPTGVTKNILGVAVLDATHAWAVGAGGYVLFYDGTTWTEQQSNTTKDLSSVAIVDANNVWAAGKGGTVIYYNGTSWATQTTGNNLDLNGVHFTSVSDGWAVGKTGVVLHYNGTAWAAMDTVAADLNKVFAVDANHVWAVGKGGLVVFYDGSGWSTQTSGTTKDILSLYFNSANEGWAVGKIGLFLYYKDGNWSLDDNKLTTKDLYSIWFTAPDNAWVVGKTGTFLQYDGIEWFSQSGGTATNLNGISFNGTTGFAVGESGVLISYNDQAFGSPLAVIYNANSDVTKAKVIDLLFGEQYFWRMRTRHALDESEWSGARSFTVKPTVELDKPTNNSTDQNLDVLLKWKKYSELVTYDIQIDEDEAFGSPIYLTSNTFSINADQLKFGTTYNWRVRALHALDVSDWSEVWKLSTVSTVVLTSPANDETNVKLSPLLEWEALTGILEYEVNFASDANFTDMLAHDIIPATEDSYIVPIVLDKEARYYWRVKAINGLDSSDWSSVWSFVTLPPVGIDEPGLAGQLNIYPNPVKDKLYIQLADKKSLDISITITDLLGKTVFNKTFGLETQYQTEAIDVSSLKEGIYMLRLSDGTSIYTRKIIITR
jgi:photosystem II stability/assembly factor-like uncharacterized protein